MCLESRSGCSQGCFLLHQGFNTVDHVLDKLLLGLSKSSPVGDVEHTIVGLGVLSVDTSDLHLVLIGHLVEGLFISHKLRKLDMDGASHGGSQVSWAGSDVTKMIIASEFTNRLDVLGSSAQSLENCSDVRSWLHRDDSELILFIDPDEESLGVIMENTSSRWPVSIETAGLKESISLPIKWNKY